MLTVNRGWGWGMCVANRGRLEPRGGMLRVRGGWSTQYTTTDASAFTKCGLRVEVLTSNLECGWWDTYHIRRGARWCARAGTTLAAHGTSRRTCPVVMATCTTETTCNSTTCLPHSATNTYNDTCCVQWRLHVLPITGGWYNVCLYNIIVKCSKEG